MLQSEAVDLLDLLPLDIASDGEVLVAAFESQDDGLGQTGVGDTGGQSDVAHLDVSGQLDLSGLDDQHIGAFGHILRGQVQRPSDVGDDTPGLHFQDVQNTFARPRCRRHDHVHVGQCGVGSSGDLDDGARVLTFDVVLQREEFPGLWGHEPQLVGGHGQQSRADGTDRSGCADHHGLAAQSALVVDLGDPQP